MTGKLDYLHNRMKNSKRILISGYYGFGNFGDDLLLVCTYRLVMERFPGASIAVLANYSENLYPPVPEPTFRNYIFKLLNPDVELVDWTHREKFDLVVHGGGGNFFDVSRGSLRDEVLGSIVRLVGAPLYSSLMRLLRALSARKTRMSAQSRLGLGLGVGPYVKGAGRLPGEAEVLGSFDRLAVRDADSLSVCSQFGLIGRTRMFSDLVFATDLWKKSLPPNPTDVVTLVICDGKPGNETLLLAAKRMQERGLKIQPVLLDPNHDGNLLTHIQSQFSRTICWDPHRTELESFAERIGSSAVVVSNRAHGIIVAACYGVPTICIHTDEKLKTIHDMLPSSSLLMAIRDIPDKLEAEVCSRILHRADHHSATVRDGARARAAAMEMIK